MSETGCDLLETIFDALTHPAPIKPVVFRVECLGCSTLNLWLALTAMLLALKHTQNDKLVKEFLEMHKEFDKKMDKFFNEQEDEDMKEQVEKIKKKKKEWIH